MKKLKISLSTGPCQDVLKDVPDNHYDSCITDPPYGLGQEPDPYELLRSWVNGVDVNTGKGFMGQLWDQVPSPKIFREIFRVLKPGSKSAFFSGTRTLHLMQASLRFAGFEIDDVYSWTYGSGFPKSHSIEKAVKKKVAARYGDKRCGCGGDASATVAFEPHAMLDIEQHDDRKIILDDYGDADLVTRVCSWCGLPDPEYLAWLEGKGTALKPSWEPIVIVRKPETPVEVNYADLLRRYGLSDEEVFNLLGVDNG